MFDTSYNKKLFKSSFDVYHNGMNNRFCRISRGILSNLNVGSEVKPCCGYNFIHLIMHGDV